MDDNITSIKDPSVLFSATKKLKSFFRENEEMMKKFQEPIPENISKLNTHKDVTLTANDVEWLNSFLKYKRLNELTDFEPLTGESLNKEICNLLNSKIFPNVKEIRKPSEVYLHELLDTSTFTLPKNEVIQRNPVLAARIERLKREQGEREYKSMTRNVDSSKVMPVEDTLAYQMNMMNRHLIAVAQFIISVGAGFAFGFLGIELLIGGLDFGFRLLLGITCALTVALAEFYFLIKHLNEEESSHSQNQPKTFLLNTSKTGKPHKD